MFISAKNISRNVVGAAGTLFFAGLCIAGATTPANAQIAYGVSETGHKVAHVSYADLNLESDAGRNSLETRIRVAAKKVCNSSTADYRAHNAQQKCLASALKATRNATMAAIEADKVAG